MAASPGRLPKYPKIAFLLDLGRFVRFDPITQNLLETLKNAQQPIEQK